MPLSVPEKNHIRRFSHLFLFAGQGNHSPNCCLGHSSEKSKGRGEVVELDKMFHNVQEAPVHLLSLILEEGG